jgi:retron-type reverse transcriptase
LIRRWLKASILEDGGIHANVEGTPQGGSISVLLSNVYLHYVLDLWFERVAKPRLKGEGGAVETPASFEARTAPPPFSANRKQNQAKPD